MPKNFPAPQNTPTSKIQLLVMLDLSRFDAAPLIAFTATKETDYGTETDLTHRAILEVALTEYLKRANA
jgi:hypothetical protein